MVHLVFFFSFSFSRRICATGNLFISKSISKIDKQIDRDEKRLRTRQWPAAMSVGSNARGSKWSQNGRKSAAGEKSKKDKVVVEKIRI